MRVILKENVDKLGIIGDVVKVSDGYARNFLLPKNLVELADEKNMARLDHLKKQLEKRRLAQKAASEELAKKLEASPITIEKKSGKGDKIFGSVGSAEVAAELEKAGFQVERKLIRLPESIRVLGDHTVTIQLQRDVEAQLKVSVVDPDKKDEDAAEKK